MKQKVAATVVMNSNNQDKRFLVKKEETVYSFISTSVAEGKTGLACILEFLKGKLSLDVNKLGLVELSNANINQENLPIFVFEIEEKDIDITLEGEYVWETPAKLREVLENYEITGVPIFQ